jgi:trigger factor
MIEDMASSYEEPEQVVNFYYSNEQQLSQIQNLVLEDQVMDKILESAAVQNVELSYDEAIKPVPQASVLSEEPVSSEAFEEE